MLLLASLIFILLAVFNYRLGGKTIFHPAVIFCLTWAGGTFLIWVSGDFFYSMLPQTVLIFLGGALAFSIGSLIISLRPQKAAALKPYSKVLDWFIGASLVFIVCCIPLGVRWMFQQVAQHPHSNFFGSVSNIMLDEEIKKTLGYSLFGNLVTFSNIIAVIAFYEREEHKKRWRFALVLALALDVFTAGRSGFVSLIFSLVSLDWIKTRRIRWKLLIALVLVMFILASAIAILLGKAGASTQASLAENTGPVMHGLVLYAAGGAVAFDKIMRDPVIQPRDLVVTTFFVQTLNKFGADLPLPNTDSGYMDLGPHTLLFNAYSIYYTYFSLGYAGMMAMMIFLGIAVTAFYRSALRGSRISAIMYGSLFGGLILSLLAEFFFDNLNYLVKLYVIAWIVYRLPGAWSRFYGVLSRGVESQLVRYKHP